MPHNCGEFISAANGGMGEELVTGLGHLEGKRQCYAAMRNYLISVASSRNGLVLGGLTSSSSSLGGENLDTQHSFEPLLSLQARKGGNLLTGFPIRGW